MTTAPMRSLDQRMAALAAANAVRLERAKIKAQIKAQEISPVVVLTDPPDCVRSMKVITFLESLPAWGPRRVSIAMRTCQIAGGKTLGGLSSRQRAALVEHILTSKRR